MDATLAIETVKTIFYFAVIPLLGICILFWIFLWRLEKLPLGPREWGTNWKILKASWNGTLPLLASEWAKKYGNLTFVYSLGQPILFLNSAEVTRKLLTSEKYKFLVADRSPAAATRICNLKGLIFSKYDAIMRKKRRMFYTVIGLYGDGVERFENVVWGEMERMFTEIDKFKGEDINITNVLARSLKNILYILAMGELPADPTIPDILEQYDLALNKLTRPDVDFVLNYLPFMTYLPGKYKKLMNEVLAAKKKADELIYYGPKKSYIPGQPRGITDLIMDHRNKPGYEWLKNDEGHILGFVTSLFVAAHLTTRSLLGGTFLCLLNYPKVIEKIREEIDAVIGDRRPKIEDKGSMPYTAASILEGLRIIAPSPISGLRRSARDIDFEGMLIPKDTLIIMNNRYYLHDENIWEDPWSFKPERFLDSEGQLLPVDHQRRKDLIAFGAGVRACPGDVFSRSRTFIILTSILQRYDILPPANEKLLPADFQITDDSVVHQTPPYKCRLIPRATTKT